MLNTIKLIWIFTKSIEVYLCLPPPPLRILEFYQLWNDLSLMTTYSDFSDTMKLLFRKLFGNIENSGL